MFAFLELTNFKSFTKISLDLRKTGGKPKKFAFIYGENGSGKSNLMLSLLFLTQTFNTLSNRERIEAARQSLSELKSEAADEDFINSMIRRQFFTLGYLTDEYRMIGSTGTMSVKIGFHLAGHAGSYFMEFDKNTVVREELRYKVTEREGIYFSIDNERVSLSPSIFTDAGYKKELRESVDKYWGKHTFLSILFNEYKLKNIKYVNSKLNEKLFSVLCWLKKLSVWHEGHGRVEAVLTARNGLFELDGGVTKDKNNPDLTAKQAMLNNLFTQLYSDVKSVFYVFTPYKEGYRYELYFRKLVDGNLLEVPFSLESSGTNKIMRMLPALFSGVIGASVFIDEIDSNIHDLLMKEICDSLPEALKGQLIATTHNTLLLESFAPENVYIIRIDEDGYKVIECVADYEKRTQKNHNMRKKYLRGDYEGIPYPGYLDFEELIDDIGAGEFSSPNPRID